MEETQKLNEETENLNMDREMYINGLFKFLVFTTIAVLIFFIPFQIKGETEILFGYIYNSLIDFFGLVAIWTVSILTMLNAFGSIYGKFIAKKETWIFKYYKNDTPIHVLIYLLGATFSILYSLHTTFNQIIVPEAIVGDDVGGLISGISLAVLFVIPLGAIFIPFFINYGSIDFVGTLLEPLMRPVFKVPGKSAVDAITSFLTSSSVAVLFTNKLYNMKFYTKKEAMTIATSFSAVSIGFAAVVIDTAGLMNHFIMIYFLSLFIAFVISLIMVRIPPLSRKPNVYIDGQVQTKENRTGEKYNRNTINLALKRSIYQAYNAKGFFKEIGKSMADGLRVLPKVLSMLFAIGVTFMILAEYTTVFNIIGNLVVPLLNVLQIPNAVEIAPSLFLGIAEMFLPVLYIADSIESIDIGARFFVTVVSMVQIIFFAETGAVMMSIGLPVKLWELVVIFILRTLIAMPIVALFMHILF